MKKTLKILLILIICLFVFSINVNANDAGAKIVFNADKSTVNPGDIITLTISMSDISINSGVGSLLAALDFDDSAFELVTVDDEELKQAISQIEGFDSFEKCEILYNGSESASVTLNPWFLIYFEAQGEKAIFGSIINAAQKNEQEIAKIKLKVKNGATAGSKSIKLISTTLVDGASVTGGGTPVEYTVSDNSTVVANVNINQQSSSGGNSKSDGTVNSQTNQIPKNNTNTSNSQKVVQANEEAPYTGVEDYIPYLLIVITITVISYMSYKKYKDIY